MKPRWYVAKYIPDLRRQEPQNIGVILDTGEHRLWRFLGQRADGSIDGRYTKWAGSVANYKAWVDRWKYDVAHSGAEIDKVLTKRLSNANFYVERSGERIIETTTTDPSDLLDYLYSVLVEETPDPRTMGVSRLSEMVLSDLGISDAVQKDFSYETPTDAPDRVTFDYRYDNGAVHLMKKVSLTFNDNRSWESAHAALWAMEKVKDFPVERGRKNNAIALVKTREPDDVLSQQLRAIEKYANVVDVGNPPEAVKKLGGLLHLVH